MTKTIQKRDSSIKKTKLINSTGSDDQNFNPRKTGITTKQQQNITTSRKSATQINSNSNNASIKCSKGWFPAKNRPVLTTLQQRVEVQPRASSRSREHKFCQNPPTVVSVAEEDKPIVERSSI